MLKHEKQEDRCMVPSKEIATTEKHERFLLPTFVLQNFWELPFTSRIHIIIIIWKICIAPFPGKTCSEALYIQ